MSSSIAVLAAVPDVHGGHTAGDGGRPVSRHTCGKAPGEACYELMQVSGRRGGWGGGVKGPAESLLEVPVSNADSLRVIKNSLS